MEESVTEINDRVKVFKKLLDSFCDEASLPSKMNLIKAYKTNVQNRNSTVALALKHGNKKIKHTFHENVLNEEDIVRMMILNMLLESHYAYLVQDITLGEIGYVMGLTKERIRQIEETATIKLKNPKKLQLLNKKGDLNVIFEYIDEVIKQKKKDKKGIRSNIPPVSFVEGGIETYSLCIEYS